MKLMQYGKIMFPHGMKDTVWIYPVAVKKYNCSTFKIDMDGKDLVGQIADGDIMLCLKDFLRQFRIWKSW